MKFSCTKENFLQALSLVSSLAGKNVNLPILNNILLKAVAQKVEVVGTNLDLAITVLVRAKVEAPGQFTVPARTLLDFINLLAEEKVDIELQENELLISAGKSFTKIKGTPADEFPVVPTLEDGQGFVIKAEDLKRGLSQVLPAVAKNDIRPELAGVFFSCNIASEREVVLAATDSYRLAEKKIHLLQGTDQLKTVIPGRTAVEMVHVLAALATLGEEENARLLITPNQIALHFNNIQMTSRLIEGAYPDYTQIIPTEFKTTALVNSTDLSKAIKAAGLFTTTGVNAVTLLLSQSDSSVKITSSSTQTGEYSAEVPASVSGEDNTVLLSHRYLLDGLNNITGDKIQLKVIDGDSPCVLFPEEDKSFLYIVMPVRQ